MHEQPLAGEQRGQGVDLFGQRHHVAADAEQPADEVLEMRRERQQQFGFLARRRRRRAARRQQAQRQTVIDLAQMGQEGIVEFFQAALLVEVCEVQRKAKLALAH